MRAPPPQLRAYIRIGCPKGHLFNHFPRKPPKLISWEMAALNRRPPETRQMDQPAQVRNQREASSREQSDLEGSTDEWEWRLEKEQPQQEQEQPHQWMEMTWAQEPGFHAECFEQSGGGKRDSNGHWHSIAKGAEQAFKDMLIKERELKRKCGGLEATLEEAGPEARKQPAEQAEPRRSSQRCRRRKDITRQWWQQQ